MAKRQQPYYRTAALLQAQPAMARPRNSARSGARSGARRTATKARPMRIPWVLIVVSLLVAIVGVWLWVDASWYVDAYRVQVIGASGETAREVALASAILGQHGLTLNAGAVISNVVNTVPDVIKVEADCRRYPATCVLTVEVREPAWVWAAPDGPRWVAADGTVFVARAERPDLPQLRGPLPDSQHIPAEILDGFNALAILGILPEELEYDLKRGWIWNDPEGRRVALGVGTEMAGRLRMYQALSDDLRTRGIFPWTMDVRFPNAPAYSMARNW